MFTKVGAFVLLFPSLKPDCFRKCLYRRGTSSTIFTTYTTCMQYRRLGRTGLKLSELSFGTWITFGNQIDVSTSETLLRKAYEAGINFFDNAEVYAAGESELVMGALLRKLGWSRDSYCVSSKVFFGDGGQLPTQKGLHRKHVVEACHAALKRLQVDYIDLYFCHRPDKETPIAETVWTMHQLIAQGKILYWGTSEWSAQEIMEAHMVAERYNLIGPVMEQPQYNILVREKMEAEYLQLFKTVGLGTTIWSPLASGVLTGKYNLTADGSARLQRAELSWLNERLLVEHTLQNVAKLRDLATVHDLSLTHMSLAWCLRNPHVSTVLLGASKPEQLRENLEVLNHTHKFTPELEAAIEAIVQNKPKLPAF
jgi:voltage-dependent potassium channel beta subunit